MKVFQEVPANLKTSWPKGGSSSIISIALNLSSYIKTWSRLHQPSTRPRVRPCKDFIVYTAASDKSCPDYPKSPTAAPPAPPRVGWPRNAEGMLCSDWPTGRQLQEAAGCMGIIDRGGGTFKVGALHLSSSTRGHNFQGRVNFY